MRIVILGMNYAPEVTGIGPYTAGLAEHLHARGHQVIVVTTFPHYPYWQVQAPYQGQRLVRERRNGVEVWRSRVWLPQKRRALSRIGYDTSLALGGLLNTVGVHAADAVLCVSPPIQAGLAGAALARRWGAPLAVLIKDLPLEAAVAVGMLQRGRAYRIGRQLERWTYQLADRLIVISAGFRIHLERQGVPPEKIVEIPDWADTQGVRPLPADAAVRRDLGAGPTDFLLLHAGNLGAKQGLASAVTAAQQAGAAVPLQLTLVGDGSDRPQLQQLVARENIQNVHFLPLQPAARFPSILTAADALLLHQRANVVNSVAPSKLLTYMAAGRAVLAAVHPDSEAARVVRAAGCGLLIPPEDPPALVRAIGDLAASPDRRSALGANGRRYAEEHYARDRVLARYETFFADVLARQPRCRPDRRS